MSTTYTRTTPFIRRIPTTGGGFYTFSSASEDLTLSFNDSVTRQFRFSKFALLNIPDILNKPYENTIKLNAIPGAFNTVSFARTTDWNVHFAESFQNYCLNLETMILSDTEYDPNEDQSVSERVFFKWLKEIGAIRFTEQTFTINGGNATRYTEEIESDNYQRVIKYLGDIDIVNNLNGQVNSYTEVYIHVPTEVGHTPDPLFTIKEDNNYAPGMTFCRDSDGLDNEILAGRHYNDVHPDNLDIHAFYDNDSGLFNLSDTSGSGLNLYKKILGKTETEDSLTTDYNINSWWFSPNSNTNCYHLEPNSFTNADNDDLAVTDSNLNDVRVRRSKLDGIQIDFDPNTYGAFNPYIGANTLIDLARSYESADFEFNAVLIYYDLYNKDLQNDGTYIENVYATNLFGILFLDNLEATSLGGALIPRFKKCRPNQVLNLNGNSYGFKINLKLNISPINSGVEVETFISDSNTFSMDVFSDVLKEMLNLSDVAYNINLSFLEYDQRIKALEDLQKMSTINRLDKIEKNIQDIQSLLISDNIATLSNDKSEIMDMITLLSNQLNDILYNKTPINVAYDLSQLKVGNGLNLKKINNTDILIENINEDYNYMIPNQIKITDLEKKYLENNNPYLTIETALLPFKNYLRFENTGNSLLLPNSLIIYVNDSNVSWSKGQILRIYFDNYIWFKDGETNSNDIWIYTDFNNIIKNPDVSEWGVRLKVPFTNIASVNWKSSNLSLEIHCMDKEKLTFLIDLIF